MNRLSRMEVGAEAAFSMMSFVSRTSVTFPLRERFATVVVPLRGAAFARYDFRDAVSFGALVRVDELLAVAPTAFVVAEPTLLDFPLFDFNSRLEVRGEAFRSLPISLARFSIPTRERVERSAGGRDHSGLAAVVREVAERAPADREPTARVPADRVPTDRVDEVLGEAERVGRSLEKLRPRGAADAVRLGVTGPSSERLRNPGAAPSRGAAGLFEAPVRNAGRPVPPVRAPNEREGPERGAAPRGPADLGPRLSVLRAPNERPLAGRAPDRAPDAPDRAPDALDRGPDELDRGPDELDRGPDELDRDPEAPLGPAGLRRVDAP